MFADINPMELKQRIGCECQVGRVSSIHSDLKHSGAPLDRLPESIALRPEYLIRRILDVVLLKVVIAQVTNKRLPARFDHRIQSFETL